MAGAFIEFVKNAEKLGKKKGRLPILSAAKFFPFKEERELISLVRNEFERAMNANIELAFNGETFADSLEEMNNNESTLPSIFVEKSRTIANSVDSNARSSFSKQSEMIIGHPYFPPENARQIVETWHSNFLELCKSAENDTKAEISRIVATAKMQGWNKNKVLKEVKERLPAKTKHRAELIARTETGKLNSSVNMETMKSVGVRYYKWLSTLDTRCRASHAVMNNVICSLDDPTIYFEDNPENGAKPIKHNRTADMVKLHPGFDFQCRCSMVMWEPEIDSKYEVKEEPIAEPPQIPQESGESIDFSMFEPVAINEDFIKKNIKISKKRRIKEKGILINKINSIDDIQKILDRLGKKKSFYRNIKLEIADITSGTNENIMGSYHSKRTIVINRVAPINSPYNISTLISAFEQLRNGEILDFYQEYMIEALYHELLHLAAKKWKSLKHGTRECYAMEFVNQIVSRYHYSHFIDDMGGYTENKSKIISNGRGYSKGVRSVMSCIQFNQQMIKDFRHILLNQEYDKIHLFLDERLKEKGSSLDNILKEYI